MPLKCRPGDAIILPNVLLLRQEIHIGHPRSMVPQEDPPRGTGGRGSCRLLTLSWRIEWDCGIQWASSTPCSARLICPKTPRASRKPGSTRSPLREPCPILLSFALCRTCQARCQSRCCLIAWRRARLAGFHAASDFMDLRGVCWAAETPGLSLLTLCAGLAPTAISPSLWGALPAWLLSCGVFAHSRLFHDLFT